MPKTRHIIAVSAILPLLAMSCGKADRVVATVDGSKITVSDVSSRMKIESLKYDPSTLDQAANFEAFRQQVLDMLVQETILLEEAKKQKIVAGKDGEIDSKLKAMGLAIEDNIEVLGMKGIAPKRWREMQRNRLVIEQLIQLQVLDKVPVADESISKYYRQHIEEFRHPTQFRARQMLVDSRESAEDILAQLKKGADFGELAKKYSLSPDGKRGGDLGYFNASSYPEIFTEICQKLEIGEMSDVIPTDYGYQIFELIDKRPARQLRLEEVTAQIRNELAEQKAQDAFKKWFEGLRQETKVSTDLAALKEVTLDEKKR